MIHALFTNRTRRCSSFSLIKSEIGISSHCGGIAWQSHNKTQTAAVLC
jgi:hypothetical protein